MVNRRESPRIMSRALIPPTRRKAVTKSTIREGRGGCLPSRLNRGLRDFPGTRGWPLSGGSTRWGRAASAELIVKCMKQSYTIPVETRENHHCSSFKYQKIAARVRDPIPGAPLMRPDTSKLGVPESVRRCLESCWDEEPDTRPDIRFVRVKLKEMQAGLKPNIFDNMLAIMEKYAYNLEGLVQERTNQLTEEKKKTDALLHRMLPKTVAESLKRGDPVKAESFECVTIFFSDIVGFTELSAVVDLLNDLYTCCDSIISHYDVYKVETIGDAYMVASGLPVRNGDRHAGEVASMALHLQAQMCQFEIRHRPGETLQLRIGIHSGHCVAGVVGLKMPRYCLFGDTVNTASRMESTGEPSQIHISETTHSLLQRLGGYMCEERGLTYIKGKGEMQTYWLLGEDPDQRLSRLRASSNVYFHPVANCVPTLETPDLIRCDTMSPLLLQNPVPYKHCQYLRQRALCAVESSLSAGDLPSPSRPTLPVLIQCAEQVERRGHQSAPSITFCDTTVVLVEIN
ncbi:Guanylate cyclase 32E [Gryllus bimaculatus]|nr:Guanylate cyclase 32E [Gryllus bimaculatus]